MVVRKIVKIDETLCTGCGKCIPKCAEGALQIVDGKARILEDVYCDGLGACIGHCPQGAIAIEEREAEDFAGAIDIHFAELQEERSERSFKPQWPVQLNLAPFEAAFYEGANLLIAADCVPVAYPAFHDAFMLGKRVMIGCPKFDDAQTYIQKFTDIFATAGIKSVTVVTMEVPCCQGLPVIVRKGMELAGKKIPMEQIIISTRGEVLRKQKLAA